MNELLSMLVPLDTLAGWPKATSPTPLQSIGLLLGFPALVFVIVVGIAKVSTLIRAGRGEDVAVTDPVWFGGRTQPVIGDTAEETAAIQARPSSAGSGADRTAAGRADVGRTDAGRTDAGGASARW